MVPRNSGGAYVKAVREIQEGGWYCKDVFGWVHTLEGTWVNVST